jgi:radical SAM protein with 4Fe4S-binding SPASM domain
MSLEDWDIVLDKLSSQPINEAKLMGLGEPFFHPHFDEICRRFKAVFPSAFTISATNCQYKINKNFIKALPFINLLYLSVDGYMESYERNRNGATWSKLIEFLDDLSNIDVKRTRITINYVVDDNNFRDIEKIHDLVSKKYNFIEEVRLNIAQWWNENEELQFELKEETYSTLIKYKQNVKGKAPWTFSDCFWPTKGFYMDVYGDVKICCLNTSTEPIGNIFKSSVEDILNAPKRRQIADECKKDTPSIHCKKCDYKRLSLILEKIFMQ